ncbi:guanine nucleotide exchange factor synembryn-like protein [Thermothelomyces thermophilus ATCC 42464]|uniref:Guanine nucleotide exchange factor synembryn-like protein n=1 Tax=Thermothelomyces thermophilus (strain ATCC 42464 / BCRC 31852 / DSM 1799) TaxID=573729 RepID=G2Q1A4_THET4|nr:guanine nucleotide exchange factor synembryn-like protein [Thermothelomyces thermophilus ATCC 42464]AEO53296.1 guanine nucleotide exchange factor synembryn-like protein [Thermothelomyces thermophilus ATCC 42464]
MAQLTGPAKLDAVRKLLDDLNEDLKSRTLQPQERDAALEQLKVYGRDPSFADPIFTKEGIETLTKFAFDSSSDITSRNALRVLCNALFLKPETRQNFVDLSYEDKACAKLKNDNRDDEFLVSRLLLLTTYGTSIDLPKLIEQHQLADSIIQNLARHAERFSKKKSTTAAAEPMTEMALAETLKLLFNVTNFAKKHVNSFDGALAPVASILCAHPFPQTKTPLDPPFSLLINTLINLDLTTPAAQAALYPPADPTKVANRLLELLDLAMKSYADSQLDQDVSPLICALSEYYKNAPKKEDAKGTAPTDPVRVRVRAALLPTDEDRKLVLGKADTLPSRLLRNWTNPLAPQFRSAVAHLYFDLSGRDPVQFVENVGYGYASGFLFENKINVPEEAMRQQQQEQEQQGGKSAAGSTGIRRDVNPITGQFLDEEKFPDLPEMTKEEKEREAERLFVLFERLKQNKVMSVQNPVEKAVQEGRFQELPDDYSEDDSD